MKARLDGGVRLETRVAEGAAPGRAERTIFRLLRVDAARGEARVTVDGVAPAAPAEVAAIVRELAPQCSIAAVRKKGSLKHTCGPSL